MTAALVLCCGGLGALARFAVDAAVQARLSGELPLGTLVVNLGGALLLGLLAGLRVSGDEMTVLGTASLGSYTTFSTWMLESHRPAQDGEPRLAWANVALSLAAGFACMALGRWLGGLL